jgi:hypothetical protein
VDSVVGFTMDQIFFIHQRLEQTWEYIETENQLFIDLKKAYDSVKREVLFQLWLEFGIPQKLVRLMKMYLNETYTKVLVGKLLSGTFPVQNGLKQGDTLTIAVQFCLRICHQESPRKSSQFGIECDTSAIGLC